MPEPIIEVETPSVFGPRKGRTAGIVGVLTALVAVVGYLREATFAARFGISTTMDAYFAAIFIPNVIYLILIAGTLSPVFIPILMQERPDENPTKASLTFSVITNFALLVMILIVSFGVLGAHLWLPRLFPGFNQPTAALALHLVYIVFPALPFLALAGILTALLNGFHKFWLAAFAPALSSLSVIAAALFYRGEKAIYVVGIATAVGFVVQCLVLLPAMASLGIRYRPIFTFRHPAIGKLLRLGIPLFLYLAVANASLVLERNLASKISAGAVSVLTYAFRLFTVPANFLAAPLAIVAYPGFVREAAREQRGQLAAQTSRLFRLVIFIFLPATVWTILNAAPVTRLLYEHGRFSVADSWITSRVLAIYSFSILPNAIAIVLLRCFFAIEDTITPLLTELVNLTFFVMAGTLFSRYFGLEGLVGARSMTFFLMMTMLMAVLARRHLLELNSGFLWFFLRTALATAAMGIANWLSLHLLKSTFDSGGTWMRFFVICILLILGAGVLLTTARLLKLNQAMQIVNTVLDLMPGAKDRGRQ
ncbi:MAG: murein biosynthesis integral membrane protein MurJ [Candidatus Angelobacter sp.]